MVKGSHMTTEQRARLSVAHIGFYPSLETRAKLSVAHLGMRVSDETRARESIVQMGHPVSDETRAKMSIADMGRTFSIETRAKLSVAAKLCRASNETKARMSIAQMGHEVSLATRAKMSEITKTKIGPLASAWKGGRTVSFPKRNAHRRTLGFVPMNTYFEGSEGHHLNQSDVIYIPKEMHRSIAHNVWTGKNMECINALATSWLTEGTFDVLGGF